MLIKKLRIKQKPLRRFISSDIDYSSLFNIIEKKYEECYLFESLQVHNHQDRYVTLGFDPYFTVSATGKKLIFKGSLKNLKKVFPNARNSPVVIKCENPYYSLREFFPDNLISRSHEGGLIGYFCYELVNCFESSLSLKEDPDFGLFEAGIYLDGLIYDKTTGILEYYSFLDDRSQLIESLVKESRKPTVNERNELDNVVCLGDSSTKKQHKEAIKYSLKEINAGNSFQTEVGFKTFYTVKGRKKVVYDELRKINPSPYMYYVKFGEKHLFGASPEILVSCTDHELITTPTAGTIKRGKTEEEDILLSRQLLTDTKERAEHYMLVDLHRNDLGKIAVLGSVKIRNLMYIIKFSHVQHIVSEIIGILDKKYDCFDVLAAILPGGVLTGAPKIETIKIISRSETLPRGPYGGAVGRFSFNGDCKFCLPIRSLFCTGDKCFTQTSGGIVLDSTPEREYDEIKRKLKAMRVTLEKLQKTNTIV